MNNTAIKVENLSKRYHLGLLHRQTNSFRDRLASLFRKRRSDRREEAIWALKDVSFQVHEGEILGIIGPNGAGKSTLLKILSRITRPTSGSARIHGRVASLLEVGTGFHPELTGRENIYLNGAILGMRKAEIRKKFDEIVAFAEIEKFIGTPVKRYSSGMYVRLAFAVAAHLQPEILLVDEVLAVGDAAFRKKCLSKMGDVSHEGRTVVFVSHNMAAINRLCERCILMDHGRIQNIADPDSVIASYLSQGEATSGIAYPEAGDKKLAVIHDVGVLDYSGRHSASVRADKDFSFETRWSIYSKLDFAQIAVTVVAMDGNPVFVTANTDTSEKDQHTMMPGEYSARVRVPGHFLNVGTYSLNVRIFGQLEGQTRRPIAGAFQALTFRIEETGSLGTKMSDGRRGFVTPQFDWTFDEN